MKDNVAYLCIRLECSLAYRCA